MKKLSALILAAMLLFTLSACEPEADETNTADPATRRTDYEFSSADGDYRYFTPSGEDYAFLEEGDVTTLWSFDSKGMVSSMLVRTRVSPAEGITGEEKAKQYIASRKKTATPVYDAKRRGYIKNSVIGTTDAMYENLEVEKENDLDWLNPKYFYLTKAFLDHRAEEYYGKLWFSKPELSRELTTLSMYALPEELYLLPYLEDYSGDYLINESDVMGTKSIKAAGMINYFNEESGSLIARRSVTIYATKEAADTGYTNIKNTGTYDITRVTRKENTIICDEALDQTVTKNSFIGSYEQYSSYGAATSRKGVMYFSVPYLSEGELRAVNALFVNPTK